jgi:hypothetical protein
MTKPLLFVFLLLFVRLGARAAHADPEVSASVPDPAPTGPGRHLVYAELLGKAGAYGVGYEVTATDRVAFGVAGSYSQLRDQTIATAVPYVHVTPWRRGANAVFGELGLELTDSRIGPAPRWMGTSTSAVGGIASLGYERTWKRIVVRGSVSALGGTGGFGPWAGLAIGVRP